MLWGVGLVALFVVLGLRRRDAESPIPVVALLVILATLGVVYFNGL
jgi:hypothetical protein